MRLIFIRHAEPDYSIDSVTAKGAVEADLLSERCAHWHVDRIFISPLGRAQRTAAPTLDKLHMTGTTLDWLREYAYKIDDPTTGRKQKVPWDFMPEYWTRQELLYDRNRWYENRVLSANPEYAAHLPVVFGGIDTLLAEYGYHREEAFYRCDPVLTDEDDDRTIVFFCHLGVMSVILGHLLGMSAVLVAQSFYIAPSSVTVLNAEKRMSNIAMFRVQTIGDTAHLYAGKEPVSASGAFSRVFSL